jgi:hypothetical protein
MDPEKEERLKQGAEALAYHVFGVFSQINALKSTVAGFDAGVRSVEQSKLHFHFHINSKFLRGCR